MKKLITASFALSIFLLFCQTSSAQVEKLYPVDEATKDPTFFTFRARLVKAIQKRDVAFVVGILDTQIINTFGGDNGIAEFKKIWTLNRPNSKLWDELGTCMALGGQFDKDGLFSAPYVYAAFPDELDGFEHAAIIGQDVRVRKAPNLNSPVIKMLSFDVVKWTSTPEENGWEVITLADNQTGYVSTDYLRSPIDYRAIFEKKQGRWVMTAFVAGD